MAHEFSATCEPLLENRFKKKDGEGITIKAEDPLTGDILDVGTTVLADDVCETYLIEDAEHMLQTEKSLSEMLLEELEKADLVQHIDNAERVPTFKIKVNKQGANKKRTHLPLVAFDNQNRGNGVIKEPQKPHKNRQKQNRNKQKPHKNLQNKIENRNPLKDREGQRKRERERVR